VAGLRRRPSGRGAGGFVLVELMVALVIGAVVLGALTGVLIWYSRVQARTAAQSAEDQSGAAALDQIAYLIRNAGGTGPAPIASLSSSGLALQGIPGPQGAESDTLSTSAGRLTDVRTVGGTQETLAISQAQGTWSVQFGGLTASGAQVPSCTAGGSPSCSSVAAVTVTLTLTAGYGARTYGETVDLRN